MRITRYARVILVNFGVLDAILLYRFANNIIWPGYVFDDQYPLLWITLEIARPIFMLSLAASAIGLFMMKRWAMILNYVQFPFRFLFVLFSFGFLTRIPGWGDTADGQQRILVLAMVLECVRLFVTIAVQLGLRRQYTPTEI